MRAIINRKIRRNIIIWSGIVTMLLLLMCVKIPAKAYSDFREFPESYRPGLKQIQAQHPNWVFVPLKTGLDWKSAVLNETYVNGNPASGTNRKSAIWKSGDESWKLKNANGSYVMLDNTGNWYIASEEGVATFMNPVNYLDEQHIFAFEQLSYNSDVHNLRGVEGIIGGTWMDKSELEDGSCAGFTYAQVILQSGISSGVSPYHLASRIFQEQGFMGNSPLISGQYGVYNYYNIGAYGSTNQQVINSGVNYARNKGWTTRFKALMEGAEFIGKNYILRGQDSIYLQKFDVDYSDGSLYSHQYMQNIQAPYTEAVSTYKAYLSSGALDQNFVFEIPVYNNMPNEKPPVDENKAKAFVTRLYNVCLGRNPDESGLDNWTGILVGRMQNGSQVAKGFVFSDEFNSKNYCNECYVKQLYRAFLGREYDEGGLEHWITLLESGQSREYVFYGFAFSDEFRGFCDEAGIEIGERKEAPKYGTIPTGPCSNCGKQDGVTEFIKRLYLLCLDREAEEEGLNFHCKSIWDHVYTGRQVARNFVFSEEFMSKGYSDEVYVEYLYRIFMDREFDEPGKAYWVDCLANGESRESVFNRFGGCQEFVDICNKYGIAN